MELADGVDASRLTLEARREGVAYLSGSRFYVGGGHENTIRLSFSYLSIEEINEGVRRLGKAIKASATH
jgi:2-aminoadipate transaminase